MVEVFGTYVMQYGTGFGYQFTTFSILLQDVLSRIPCNLQRVVIILQRVIDINRIFYNAL